MSESFIAKPWPERELRGLVAREIAEQLVIIPIFFGVSSEEVRRFSPPLADSFALKASSMTAEEMAISLLKRIRPDIYASYSRLELEGMVRGKALEKLQMELNKVKDELKELIATEIRNVVKLASSRVVNSALGTGRWRLPTPEDVQESETRKRIARDIANVVIEATEDYLREAQANVVQKTDPQRAEVLRKLKPEF